MFVCKSNAMRAIRCRASNRFGCFYCVEYMRLVAAFWQGGHNSLYYPRLFFCQIKTRNSTSSAFAPAPAPVPAHAAGKTKYTNQTAEQLGS